MFFGPRDQAVGLCFGPCAIADDKKPPFERPAVQARRRRRRRLERDVGRL